MKTLSLFFVVALIAACSGLNAVSTQDDPNSITFDGSSLAQEKCGDTLKLVKRMEGATGHVSYRASDRLYTITVHQAGTYDVVDVGIVCNLPEKAQKTGLRVTFDGEYYPFSRTLSTMQPVGYTYYYLHLTKIQFSKD